MRELRSQTYREEHPSMKVPPKRKGNQPQGTRAPPSYPAALNESPSEKEGKCHQPVPEPGMPPSLNESPSEKEGKWRVPGPPGQASIPSMKVPPKRKGNWSDKVFCLTRLHPQ